MAIPTQFSFSMLAPFTSDGNERNRFDKICMAADTVLLNNINACLFYEDHLRFKPKREHERVSKSVVCLERELAKNVVVWNVAIVTDCRSTVAPPLPRSILRSHDMAIRARFRTIGEVRRGVGNMEDQHAETAENTQHDQHGEPPLLRRDNEIDDVDEKLTETAKRSQGRYRLLS